ncbi:MAG: DMT family transporter [Hyphomicrobium sp.]
MHRKLPTPSAAGEARQRLEAIGLMLIAVGFFSALDTSAKYLVTREGLGVGQIVWARCIGQFALLLLLVPSFGIMSARALFQSRIIGWQLVRSALMVATTAFNFLALEYLRLDQTVTIVFLAPLMVALLAGPLLGEWVGRRTFAAILVGFAGVLIAVRPGFGNIHPAVLYSFAGMLAYAFFIILTRRMAHVDPPLVTLFYSMFAGTVGAIPFAVADWVTPPDALSWVLLGVLGILGGLGHWLFLHAYRLAPASAIAPFLYTQLLTMVAFGFIVFGDLPDLWTLAGAALIVASGIYLIHRERQVARELADATALS